MIEVLKLVVQSDTVCNCLKKPTFSDHHKFMPLFGNNRVIPCQINQYWEASPLQNFNFDERPTGNRYIYVRIRNGTSQSNNHYFSCYNKILEGGVASLYNNMNSDTIRNNTISTKLSYMNFVLLVNKQSTNPNPTPTLTLTLDW